MVVYLTVALLTKLFKLLAVDFFFIGVSGVWRLWLLEQGITDTESRRAWGRGNDKPPGELVVTYSTSEEKV